MESAFLFSLLRHMFTSSSHFFVSRFFISISAVACLLWVAPGTLQAASFPSSLELTASDYKEVLDTTALASWFRLSTTILPQKSRSEAVDTSYCLARYQFCEYSLSRFTRMRLATVLKREPNQESIAAFVEALATKVNQEPANALFGADDHGAITVAVPEKIGRTLDQSASTELILRALAGEASGSTLKIALPTLEAHPKIAGADRERLGLKELIGEGKSNFKGSPKNRVFNINRALKQYENILIAPGEEFSFVDYLGEVDGEHGYLPELVIKYNKTEPEFGGGICQVSSTVFRAAIYSGLKITERRNHAYAVQYYKPIGMDATIYIPKPDLKFTNNTPGYILMQPHVEGFDLTFRFFGTKDGRQVAVDGPHVLSRGDDGSMKTVFTQEVNDANGQNFIRDSFYSNYKSPALFPHPGEEQVFTSKPADWSEKQWKEYRATRS